MERNEVRGLNTAPVGEELAVYAEVLRVKRIWLTLTHPKTCFLSYFSIMTGKLK